MKWKKVKKEMQDDGLLPKGKKKKPTLEEVWEELKELERKHNESLKGGHVCPPCYLPHYPQQPYYPPTSPNTTNPSHYHNGQPCYNNPCYWC